MPGRSRGWPGATSWLVSVSCVRNVRVCASASGAIFVTVRVSVRPSNASAVTGSFWPRKTRCDGRRVEGRVADHRVGHAEVDVDRGDVDQPERDLVGGLALAGLDVLLGDGRVVERHDELAVDVVVVRLVELHPRVRQRVLRRLPARRPR